MITNVSTNIGWLIASSSLLTLLEITTRLTLIKVSEGNRYSLEVNADAVIAFSQRDRMMKKSLKRFEVYLARSHPKLFEMTHTKIMKTPKPVSRRQMNMNRDPSSESLEEQKSITLPPRIQNGLSDAFSCCSQRRESETEVAVLSPRQLDDEVGEDGYNDTVIVHGHLGSRGSENVREKVERERKREASGFNFVDG